MIRFLLWVGLIVRRYNPETGKYDGAIRWPLHFAPLWMWKHPIATARCVGWFYVFRNCKGVIKWREGRLLPIRWGFGIGGLIEFGDRG